MNWSLLDALAEVRTGVTFRGRDATRPDPQGSVQLIRIGDLSDDGNLINTDLHRIEPTDPISRYQFLRPGDVIFPNRGTRNTAHAFRLPETNVIVGAQFFVISPRQHLIFPEYLAWFLRGETAAKSFKSLRKGTLVQILQRNDIGGLFVPTPPLETQKAIVALDSLAIQERQLTSRLADVRFHLTQRHMLNAASRD